MTKRVCVFTVLAVGLLAYLGWSTLHPQKAVASDDPSGTFLISNTDATTGAFASQSVITLHSDGHSAAVSVRPVLQAFSPVRLMSLAIAIAKTC